MHVLILKSQKIHIAQKGASAIHFEDQLVGGKKVRDTTKTHVFILTSIFVVWSSRWQSPSPGLGARISSRRSPIPTRPLEIYDVAYRPNGR